jgi:hypothetical protein
MNNQPEWVLELYRNHKMAELEDALSRDLERADQYIHSLVAQGIPELQAEDRAVELLLAPADGPEFSDNPPTPVPPELQEEISDRLEEFEDESNRQLDRQEQKQKKVRQQIIQTYAEWTAMSALRSGAPIKSRRDVLYCASRSRLRRPFR